MLANIPKMILITSFLLWNLSSKCLAQVVYHVTVDTSPIAGISGNLDFQFNPAGGDALDASVGITNFSTDGTLAATSTNTGDATGTLPGPPVIIRNTDGFNDLYQGFIYGQSFSFDATFDGLALSPVAPIPSSGSGLAVSLYDAAATQNFLTTSPDGSVIHLDINQDGSTSVTPFADSIGVFRASATLVPASVPEPSASVLLTLGIILSALLYARQIDQAPKAFKSR